MLKKLFAAVLALTLTFGLGLLFIGCGDEDGSLPTVEASLSDSTIETIVLDYAKAEILPETEKAMLEKKEIFSQYGIIYGETHDKSFKVVRQEQTADGVIAKAVESGIIDLVIKDEGPTTTSYTFNYRLSLAKDGNDWIVVECLPFLTSETVNDPHGDPPIPRSMPCLSDGPESDSEEVTSLLAPAFAATYYNANAAVRYALAHAENPDFDNYPDLGLNCTNFISQCMIAGGWNMKYGWYWSNKAWWHTIRTWWGFKWHQQSYTWGGARNFYWFTYFSGRGTPATSWSQLKEGDVIQRKKAKIDHSLIVTDIDARGKIYISYQTPNTRREALSAFRSRYPGAIYYLWRMSN